MNNKLLVVVLYSFITIYTCVCTKEIFYLEDMPKDQEEILADPTVAQAEDTVLKDELSQTTTTETAKYKIDGIVAICFLDDGSYVITEAAVKRPLIDGTQTSLEELISIQLVCQEATKNLVERNEQMIDAYFDHIMTINRITKPQMVGLLEQAGYSEQEAREQIGQLLQMSTFFNFKFGAERISISNEDIKAYDDQFPAINSEQFQIQRAVINSSDMNEDMSVSANGLFWTEPFWVAKNEVASEKQYIFDLQPGEMSTPHSISEGYEVFRMVQHKAETRVSWQERRSEITSVLSHARHKQQIDQYKQELREKASIFIPTAR